MLNLREVSEQPVQLFKNKYTLFSRLLLADVSSEHSHSSLRLPRLQAAERAIRFGLVHHCSDGLAPRSDSQEIPVTRGCFTATRTGKSCLVLTRAVL